MYVSQITSFHVFVGLKIGKILYLKYDELNIKADNSYQLRNDTGTYSML
jgi:hypothetical protein